MPGKKSTAQKNASGSILKGCRGTGAVNATRLEGEAPNDMRPPATIAKLPVYVRPKAFELLAAQPISLVGMSQAERNLVVVTAVADELGNEYLVSRIGDPVWHLASEQEAKNKKTSHHYIAWPQDIPKALLDDTKAALYCALRRGPHGRPWSGSYVERAGKNATRLLRHLASLNIANFSQVRALHLSDYVADLKRTLDSSTIRHRIQLVDLVWHFPMEVFHPLPQHPWAGASLSEVCGLNADNGGSPVGRTGKTPVIPRSVQRTLFAYCESRLTEADELFEARDSGKLSPSSHGLTAVRDAVLYLTQVTSGMRNSESMGVTNDCWRREVRNGVTFHWVQTREIKTGQGIVEYLVPPEAFRALAILQRYAKPLQARLADEARWLEAQMRNGANKDGVLANEMTVAEAVSRLNHVREIDRHLFLSVDKWRSDHLGSGSRVEVMSVEACNAQLKALARAAGSDWELANHQCRRTFAYNVANSRLGCMGLVFLKWQLKHASISWTQLYAANPYQDITLYRELEDEQTKARVELIEGWMQPDMQLSGGAGRKLIQTRATPVRNMKDLLLHTAKAVEIRNTGHAWCLSGTRVCHGQGVYEPANCAGCSQAVIDRDQAFTWQAIHLENLRLAAVTDCGPAVVQKALRAIRRSEEVLKDLGVPLLSSEMFDAYVKTGAIHENN
ncbi:tyrosine-type recombinase/integrase [Burkholderia pseudomallei]|uniref:tyrosine-type recombinase/integrase n=1 Tax=Burkholderia pseudomallei TaxID=28450 RepID=UPI0005DA4EB2|nr:tyrosine-type recombinase/integrase [Burkholderia pseudomallei]AJX78759.1 phage integrase family protein [Burkholderia pseudomallei MSHR2543]